jgi:nucleoid-associated protein YgaU
VTRHRSGVDVKENLMGIFDFVKEAGEKIFGRDDDQRADAGRRDSAPSGGKMSPSRETSGSARTGSTSGAGGRSAPSATATPTFEQAREAALRKVVERNGFPVEGLVIDIQGERVVVAGRVPTQDVREKVVLVVGNVAGVAQVDDRLEVTSKGPAAQESKPSQGTQPSSGGAQAQSTFYTVKRGDTLSKIAKEHYGNANDYPKIFEANRPMLQDPDKIYPGQVLRIPAKG